MSRAELTVTGVPLPDWYLELRRGVEHAWALELNELTPAARAYTLALHDASVEAQTHALLYGTPPPPSDKPAKAFQHYVLEFVKEAPCQAPDTPTSAP